MLDDLQLPVKITSCRVRTLKQGLSEADALILENAVMNASWQYTALARELRLRGLQISDQSLRRHRLKECTCWRI